MFPLLACGFSWKRNHFWHWRFEHKNSRKWFIWSVTWLVVQQFWRYAIDCWFAIACVNSSSLVQKNFLLMQKHFYQVMWFIVTTELQSKLLIPDAEGRLVPASLWLSSYKNCVRISYCWLLHLLEAVLEHWDTECVLCLPITILFLKDCRRGRFSRELPMAATTWDVYKTRYWKRY
jgi:hypothetical protein